MRVYMHVCRERARRRLFCFCTIVAFQPMLIGIIIALEVQYTGKISPYGENKVAKQLLDNSTA